MSILRNKPAEVTFTLNDQGENQLATAVAATMNKVPLSSMESILQAEVSLTESFLLIFS